MRADRCGRGCTGCRPRWPRPARSARSAPWKSSWSFKAKGCVLGEAARRLSRLLGERSAVLPGIATGRQAGLVAERRDALIRVGDFELGATQLAAQRQALVALREISVRRTFERVIDDVAGFAG